MTMTFFEFLSEITSNFPLLVTAILTSAVIIVNGWTDAPNAIASCVSTRAMTPKAAIIMAAVLNFLGVYILTLFNAKVAATTANMVDFGDDPRMALIALCAALVAIVVWATAAWFFGIPTSESHALIAGLSGAAIAIMGGVEGINWNEWVKVIYGLILSTVLGFGLGWGISKLTVFIAKNFDRRKTTGFFNGAQILGAAGMAFMHGAQDGQGFMGVFMLGMFMAKGFTSTEFIIPTWLMIYCSIVMALGTSIGGYKIIKSVGMDMVKLEKHQGFAADFAGAISLYVATAYGLPVSTTQAKTTAIMGVGAANKMSSVNWSLVKEMVLTWVFTFPGCGVIGWIMAKLFLKIF